MPLHERGEQIEEELAIVDQQDSERRGGHGGESVERAREEPSVRLRTGYY